MGAIATLVNGLLIVAVCLTGLIYIVTPPAGREIAKRTAKVVLVLFVIDAALSYLWRDWTGRLLLIATGIFLLARVHERKE